MEAGEITNPKLLLIHGLGGSIKSWIPIFDSLAKRFHVIALDLPGFGRSDEIPGTYTMKHYANIVCSLMKSIGFHPAFLMGHSMGALIAIKTYLMCTEKIQGLILIDSTGISKTIVEKIKQYMGDRWNKNRLKELYLDCILGKMGKLNESELDEWLNSLKDPKFYRAYMSCLNSMLKEIIHVNDLRKVKVPTLIIWGSEDKLTPVEDGIKLSKLITMSKFILIEGAGHVPHSEAPEVVLQLVTNFISGLKAPS
ncbi:MAG: alpha/beta hydrolase [Desulfurococcaceae archaeon]